MQVQKSIKKSTPVDIYANFLFGNTIKEYRKENGQEKIHDLT